MEEKVVGTWSFDKVTSRNTASFVSKDMTANFKYFTFQFQSNGSIISMTTHNGDTHIGRWTMVENNYWIDDVMHTEYILRFDAIMPEGTPPQVVNLVWRANSITATTLRAEEEFDGKFWQYRLNRLDP